MTLKNQIRGIVSSELGIPLEEIPPDLEYGETPEWDSNSHMVLVIAIEDAFSVTFESEEIVTLVSLDGIREALLSKGVADCDA